MGVPLTLLAILVHQLFACGSADVAQHFCSNFNYDSESAIHHAVCERDGDALREMLDSGEWHVDHRATPAPYAELEDISPLMLASYVGWHEGAIMLIEHGAEVDARSAQGFTPLFYAARSDCTECVKSLIAGGAEVNRRCDHGVLPLHYAATLAGTRTVQELLESGSHTDELALCWAVNNRAEDVAQTIELLISHGAPLLGDCGDDRYPLSLAIAEVDNERAALALLEATPLRQLETTDASGHSAFLLAARSNQCEVLEELMRRGVRCDRVNHRGENALHLLSSSHWDGSPCFSKAVDCVGQVDQRDVQGRTPLIVLATEGSRLPERALILLEAGADIDALDSEGHSALQHIIRRGASFHEAALLLVQHGARVDRPDRDGVMPIDRARGWRDANEEYATGWQDVIDAIQARLQASSERQRQTLCD